MWLAIGKHSTSIDIGSIFYSIQYSDYRASQQFWGLNYAHIIAVFELQQHLPHGSLARVSWISIGTANNTFKLVSIITDTRVVGYHSPSFWVDASAS